jgi:hypothetical protein
MHILHWNWRNKAEMITAFQPHTQLGVEEVLRVEFVSASSLFVLLGSRYYNPLPSATNQYASPLVCCGLAFGSRGDLGCRSPDRVSHDVSSALGQDQAEDLGCQLGSYLTELLLVSCILTWRVVQLRGRHLV